MGMVRWGRDVGNAAVTDRYGTNQTMLSVNPPKCL